MISIPPWIANVLFLIICYLSGFQHVQFKRLNPVMNLQFFMMAFSLTMIWVNAVYDHNMPWLSLAFLLLAVSCFALMVRQHRLLPPRKPFE